MKEFRHLEYGGPDPKVVKPRGHADPQDDTREGAAAPLEITRADWEISSTKGAGAGADQCRDGASPSPDAKTGDRSKRFTR